MHSGPQLVFRAHLDFLSRRFQALRADLQVDAGLVDRLQRVLQREVAVLEELQLLVQLGQRLLVRKVLAHGSTSSTRAPNRPEARLMRTRPPLLTADAAVTTAPES